MATELQNLRASSRQADGRTVGVRAVLVLAWPLMIAMLSRSLMNASDTLFVSRLGTTALAAVGLATTASYAVLAFGMGVMGAVSVVVARSTGAGEDTSRLSGRVFTVALGLGLAMATLAPLGTVLFPLLGATSEASRLAAAFFAIRIAGAPLDLISVALGGWFQGRGDTRTPMVATVTANLLNIVFAPLLVFGLGPVPALGMPGAALGTELALAVGVGWLVWKSRPRPALPGWVLLRQIWRVGGPLGAHYSLDVFAFLLFASLLARVGEVEMAAHVMVLRIISLSFLPGHAVADAAAVLVGQSLGAGQARRAHEAWSSAIRLGVGLMMACAAVFALLPGPLIAIFGPSPEVARVAAQLMWIAAFFQLFDAVATISFGALRGAGDTRYTLWLGVGASWFVKLPLGILFAIGFGWGAAGAWWGLTAEIVVVAVLAGFRARGTRWLLEGRRLVGQA